MAECFILFSVLDILYVRVEFKVSWKESLISCKDLFMR